MEYCEPNLLISREQYYIDCLKPKYNILTTAGSRLGSIQSQKTRQYISKVLINRVFSDESRDKMKIAAKHRLGDKTSFFGKTHKIATKNKISLTKYVPVKVTNVKTNNITIFASNKDAAEYLRIGESTLRKYKKQAKLLLGKYLITNDIKKP
jgi:group I intron endonuclease